MNDILVQDQNLQNAKAGSTIAVYKLENCPSTNHDDRWIPKQKLSRWDKSDNAL